MAMGKILVVLLMVMVAALEGSRAETTLCKMNEDGLNACKPSVTKPDPVPASPECCQALSGADLECLCSYRNSLILPALGIDPDLAMTLPSQCKLTPPPNCKG